MSLQKNFTIRKHTHVYIHILTPIVLGDKTHVCCTDTRVSSNLLMQDA